MYVSGNKHKLLSRMLDGWLEKTAVSRALHMSTPIESRNKKIEYDINPSFTFLVSGRPRTDRCLFFFTAVNLVMFFCLLCFLYRAVRRCAFACV